ncbi:hypothetical protein [Dongia sp. agr-C8]
MLGIVGTVVAQLAAYASFAGLYFTIVPFDQERPISHWVVIGFGCTVGLALLTTEVRAKIRSLPKTYKKTEQINQFMERWVSSRGQIVIFSRDMSWASKSSILTILIEKARNRELTVYVKEQVEVTRQLAAAGAKIITYGQLNHEPKSRFTIVGYGVDGARVAVGVTQKDRHVIEEFESGEHPYFSVAEDLIKFVRAANS